MTPYEAVIHELSQILIKKGVLTEKNAREIQQAFHESPSDNFIDFLLEEGFVEREDLLAALSTYYKVPSFETQGYFFDQILVRDFPKDILLRHAVIPLRADGDILCVIAANPTESNLATILAEYTNSEVVFYVGLRESICNAIKEFYDMSLMEEEQDEDLRDEYENEQMMHHMVDEPEEASED